MEDNILALLGLSWPSSFGIFLWICISSFWFYFRLYRHLNLKFKRFSKALSKTWSDMVKLYVLVGVLAIIYYSINYLLNLWN